MDQGDQELKKDRVNKRPQRPQGRPRLTPGQIKPTTIPLHELAEQLGCNPFEILCRFALGDALGLGYPSQKTLASTPKGDLIERDVISVDMRIKAAEAAAAYLYPKRKAVEHSGQITKVHVEKLSAIEVKSILQTDPFLTKQEPLKMTTGEEHGTAGTSERSGITQDSIIRIPAGTSETSGEA